MERSCGDGRNRTCQVESSRLLAHRRFFPCPALHFSFCLSIGGALDILKRWTMHSSSNESQLLLDGRSEM
jgi:hypothetical protein